MDLGILGTIVKWLLLCGFVMFTMSLLDRAKRGHATERDGWRHLTPGPMLWIAFGGSLFVSTALGLIYLFGSVRQGDPSQSAALLTLTVGFNLGAMLLAYIVIGKEFRWNTTHIQARNFLFKTRTMTWHQLAAVGYEPWSGCYWISGYDGPRIRFSPYDNGFPELMATVLAHLPPDLPPAESDLVQQAKLVYAPVRAQARR